MLYNGPLFPSQNCPFPCGHLDPHLVHDSLGPSEPKTQMVSRSVQPLLNRWPNSIPMLYNGPPFPFKIAPSLGGCWYYLFPWGLLTLSNTWLLEPTWVLNPNGISIGSAIFAGLTSVTDRQTDRHTDRSRIYTRSTVTRPIIIDTNRAKVNMIPQRLWVRQIYGHTNQVHRSTWIPLQHQRRRCSYKGRSTDPHRLWLLDTTGGTMCEARQTAAQYIRQLI